MQHTYAHDTIAKTKTLLTRAVLSRSSINVPVPPPNNCNWRGTDITEVILESKGKYLTYLFFTTLF
jgi:hypothetical protein